MGMMLGGRERMLSQEVSKPKNVRATLRRFWRYFRQFRGLLLIVVLLLIASTWTQIRAPQLIGQAIDCYILPTAADECRYDENFDLNASRDERLEGLGRLAIEVVILFVAGSVMIGVMFFTMSMVGQRALRNMRQDMFTHLNRLSLGFYAKKEAGDIMSRFTNDAETIRQAISFALISVLRGSLLIVWITGAMLLINVPYALLSLTTVPLMLLATTYFSQQARKAFRISRQEMGSVNADLQESISGVREVQAFNREAENIHKFRQVNAANRDANVRAASFTSALQPVLEGLGYVALAVVVVVGGLSALRNEPLLGTSIISLGTVIVFLQYVQRFNEPIQQISVLWTNIQSAIASGERIFNFLDETPDLVDRRDARPMPAIQGQVEFKNVYAEYKVGEPVLRGVSFRAAPGQTIAIVGPTGAGKTTIINLIPRFYEVTGGAVEIDGFDVREVTAASLRSQIAVVLQDTFLFSDTVLNNIRYGKLEASDEEVIDAAKAVAADSFIERLPDGYQTVLGERGTGLSQGQRQLISIARAALMNPRLLILDEATSSVDTRTERLIQKALDNLQAGRTSFVIAHRLSTVRNADVVLMVKDGQIIEQGTFDELLVKQGAFYELYMSQFYVEEASITTADNLAAPA